ncbi:hypothetical protein F2Q69_00011235 [Brassica cretica]|uniref:Uncharacterized protein n=1 Tax=Brassica cretica TaxID=69181 RepID=A0A8S9R1L0_BRACR|nr:hypothetical protein F2Q69_00011235 [Brassica cretica]
MLTKEERRELSLSESNLPRSADSVENTHPDREGESRNVEQSTQAQPEENSVAHDQDEMPSESEAETQVEAPKRRQTSHPSRPNLVASSPTRRQLPLPESEAVIFLL